MLNEFLKVAYNTSIRDQEKQELDALLSKLPVSELHKLASGTPIAALYGHMDKKAYCETTGTGEATWLDQFKGTPLFDQAIALEQQELQAEVLDMQKRQERRAQTANEDTLYDQRDKLRVQKKLLALELAKQQGGAGAGAPPAAPPGEPAQGAGAPGPVPAEGVQDNAQGLGGGVAKLGGKGFFSRMEPKEELEHYKKHPHRGPAAMATGSAVGGGLMGGAMGRAAGLSKGKSLALAAGSALAHGGLSFGAAHLGQHLRKKRLEKEVAKEKASHTVGTPEEKIAFADNMGRALARQDFEKAAHTEMLSTTGVRAGTMMAKTALPNMAALGGMASKALGFAAKNKALVGAGIGAAGGALAGGEGHRLSGAIGGAATGAAAGAGIQHIQNSGGMGNIMAHMPSAGGASPKGALPGPRASTSVLGRATPTPASAASLVAPDVSAFQQKPGLFGSVKQQAGTHLGALGNPMPIRHQMVPGGYLHRPPAGNPAQSLATVRGAALGRLETMQGSALPKA